MNQMCWWLIIASDIYRLSMIYINISQNKKNSLRVCPKLKKPFHNGVAFAFIPPAPARILSCNVKVINKE